MTENPIAINFVFMIVAGDAEHFRGPPNNNHKNLKFVCHPAAQPNDMWEHARYVFAFVSEDA